MTTTPRQIPERDHLKPPLIIDRPELVSASRRTLYGFLTALVWAVWIYLWLPLVSLLAWFLGAQRFVDVVLPLQQREDLLTLQQYAAILLLTIVVTALWSLYNLRHFGHHDRRHAPSPIDDAEIAQDFHLRPQILADLRDSRRATLDVDEDGELRGLVVDPV